ncbi:MAG: ABC-type cobalamin/Fe3+-siderophore transport system, ATPase component [Anaerocolumna sp.]|jgi:iron complex transport system ATP-binding protein|nr:ABC-type cobalamin/Fe3+-siderophore transport system, ATPase component [Anaerocolumna sp.]
MSIEINNLSFGYKNNEVLHNISFEIKENCLISILGPNGIGKTTLFKCMLGLLSGYKGNIYYNDKNIKSFTSKALANTVAYIPQSHYPTYSYSVLEMVLMGTTSHITKISGPGKSELEKVEEALETIGITHLKYRGYSNISGGERQLVLIARALAQKAKILIMDEPTANLDYGNQIKVLTIVKQLVQAGYTIIQSTHQPDHAFLYADRVLALLGGHIVKEGTPKNMITSDLIKTLYGIDVDITSLYDDYIRVCIPKSIIYEHQDKLLF